MHRPEIPLDNWLRMELLLPSQRGGHGGVAEDNRLFLNAVWYVATTGIPWRDLPERFGKWDTVYHRFNEWSNNSLAVTEFASVKCAADRPMVAKATSIFIWMSLRSFCRVATNLR